MQRTLVRTLFVSLGIVALVLQCYVAKVHAQQVAGAPTYKVDPSWPKPLPATADKDGQLHRWVLGEVGGVCIDNKDRIIAYNRGWQFGSLGKIKSFEAWTGVAAPPIVIFDTDGNVVGSWGDTTLVSPNGAAKVLPEAPHGCFVDYEGNIWLGGAQDGVAQKWSPDGSKLLLQIGTKGTCDGEANAKQNVEGQASTAFHPTCNETNSRNNSKTLLSEPADFWVDPNPDPVTKQKGSVYIADGYGNHRVVVFDSTGKFLRQWGEAGDGPGQFGHKGGGHPHCVAVANDGMVYACDRPHDRIFETDRLGKLIRTIDVKPVDGPTGYGRATDVEFSRDPEQKYIYDVDMGNAVVHIIERKTGKIVGKIGVGPGHNAGQFTAPHQLVIDSKGNVYVAETIDSRRLQKFVPQ